MVLSFYKNVFIVAGLSIISAAKVLAMPTHFYELSEKSPTIIIDQKPYTFSSEQKKLIDQLAQEFLDCGDDRILDSQKPYFQLCNDGKALFEQIQPAYVFSKDKPLKVEMHPFSFIGLNLASSDKAAQLVLAQLYSYDISENVFKFMGAKIFFLPPNYGQGKQINWIQVENEIKNGRLVSFLGFTGSDVIVETLLKKITDGLNGNNAGRGLENSLAWLESQFDEKFLQTQPSAPQFLKKLISKGYIRHPLEKIRFSVFKILAKVAEYVGEEAFLDGFNDISERIRKICRIALRAHYYNDNELDFLESLLRNGDYNQQSL